MREAIHWPAVKEPLSNRLAAKKGISEVWLVGREVVLDGRAALVASVALVAPVVLDGRAVLVAQAALVAPVALVGPVVLVARAVLVAQVALVAPAALVVPAALVALAALAAARVWAAAIALGTEISALVLRSAIVVVSVAGREVSAVLLHARAAVAVPPA